MASKICIFIVLFILSLPGYSQRDRVHLDLDKYSCRAGDTVYFKATVFKGAYPFSQSTNLYVQQYTDSGRLLQSQAG